MLGASGPAAADDWLDCNAADMILKTDPGRAVAACRRLAESGDAVAQYNLGLMYQAGQGLPQDDARAALWYRRAAERGDAPAQYSLGRLTAEGRGVPRSLAEAVTWYRKAAMQGYVYAQTSLGFMYATGQGVPVDKAQADLWLSLAADAGDGTAADFRDFLEQDMSAEERAEAARLIGAWKPDGEAAGTGDSVPRY
jgi:hypothetical protein